ncbi:MAG: hypothetical protein Tsb0032_23770 [Kiloniellaceae bacterium]
MSHILARLLSAFVLTGLLAGPGAAGAAEPLRISQIEAMPAGSWLQYGRPWREVDPGRDDNCGADFGAVLGAWNGVLWDGRYIWSWAAGGHGDGCFNGILRYDLQAGKPEMVVPHLPLNVPLCWAFDSRNGQQDCWNEPYVSATPWPAGMDLEKAARLNDGPALPAERFREEAAVFGDFLRPRSSHMYNNIVRIGDHVYLLTGQTYGAAKLDGQVWRFAVNDPANTIERLPDRWDPDARGGRGDFIGRYNVDWVQPAGRPALMFSGALVCTPDLVAGKYPCIRLEGASFSASATLAWDETRGGVWALDANRNNLLFLRETESGWAVDAALSVSDEEAINKDNVGAGGLCVVPTPQGGNPVIWGRDSELLRWDGKQLRRLAAPGAPAPARRRVYNKWAWNADLGVCLGTWSVDEGIWAYKPDFLTAGGGRDNAAQAAATPGAVADAPPDAEPVPAPAPSAAAASGEASAPAAPQGLPPAPSLNPDLTNNPLARGGAARTSGQAARSEPAGAAAAAGDDVSSNDAQPDARPETEPEAQTEKAPPPPPVNLKKDWWISPADYPSFAGHKVAPAPWTPAPWDQRIERQPEAPDYDALCPGPWAELHYRSEEDLAGSARQMRGMAKSGTANVRIYLHPRVDDNGQVVAYTHTVKFDDVRCSEIIGVPLNGEKPQMTGAVAASGVGLIVRGIMFKGQGVRWRGNRATNEYPAFVVLHDLDIYAVGSLMGDSRPEAPLTYLEFRGNVIGNNTDWHVIYLERSIGQMVALGNIFYGSGRTNHAFKNLAHQSRIEGNVFSNVGIDGQVLREDRRGREVVGQMPLDLYLCTETVFRDNTVLFRTSGSVRAFMAYRGRRAWGNCNKGRRLDNGRWEIWSPQSHDYQDPGAWAEIHEALKAFDRGYDAAKAEPWLFTHRVEGNTFIAFNAQQRDGEPFDDTVAVSVNSLRPVANNPLRSELDAEARALSKKCAPLEDPAACVLEGMSPGLRYAYEHISAGHQRTMVANGDLPRGVPIQAPEAWVERAGVFWGSNDFITCSADGRNCRRGEPRPLDAAPRPWDELEVAQPPRVIRLR